MNLYARFYQMLLLSTLFVLGCGQNRKSVGTLKEIDSHTSIEAVEPLERADSDTLSSDEVLISGVPLSKLKPEDVLSMIPETDDRNRAHTSSKDQLVSVFFDDEHSWVDFLEIGDSLRAIGGIITSDKIGLMKQNFKVGSSIVQMSKAGYKIEPIPDYENSFEVNIWFKDSKFGIGYLFFETEEELLIDRIGIRYLIDEDN